MPSKRTNKRQPLFDESLLDTEVQKQVILGLFTLVQAWKVYDLILLNTNNIQISNFTFILKYFFLDSLVITAIPILNLPQLPFSFGLSFIILSIVNLFTFTLTSNFSFLSSFLLPMVLPKEKELEIMENLVDPLIDQSIHFKGKKKLRMAPDSSIKLNPSNEIFCLKPLYNSVVNIPFDLDSMNGLEYLQINHIDVNNNLNVLNLTNPSSSFLSFENPGYYSIRSAIDKRGKSIKSFKTNTFIPVCPEVSFQQIDLSQPKCENHNVGLSVQMFGVPPFTLFIQEEINGKLSNLNPIDSIIPTSNNEFDSPLNDKREITKSDIIDLSWMKSKSITLPINKNPLKSGNYVYSISKIIDGFGNEIIYKPDLSNRDTLINFKVLKNPSFELYDPQPNIPILLGRKKSIDIKIKDCGDNNEHPILEFLYTPFSDDKINKIEKFTREFPSTNGNKLEIEKSGIYSIINGKCSICSGKSFGSEISIENAKLPDIDIKLDEIVDNCVGTTGFKFNFHFTGSQPFEIGYKISKLDPKDSNKVLKIENISKLISNSNSYEYEFNPKSEGSYSIEFINLSDRYYKNQIKFNDGEHRYITYFKQRPKISFAKPQLMVCNSQSTEIDINLDGKFPFNLSYDLISPNGDSQTFNEFNIQSSPFKFQTPIFAEGGEYKIRLHDVIDSSSCDVEFNIKEIKLNVRSDIPKISFLGDQNHFDIVQGTFITVPLDKYGSMELSYSHQSDSGEIENLKISNISKDNGGLKLEEAGVYKLVSFSQYGCPGDINDEKSITIDYLPKPYLKTDDTSIIKFVDNEHQMNSICQNSQSQINLSLFGSAPFVIKYTVAKPNGELETKMEQVENDSYLLPIQSQLSGKYTYTITGIYDSLYSADILKLLSQRNFYQFDPIIINQSINGLPSGQFINEDNGIYETCVLLPNGVKPIVIELIGQKPLDLKLNVFHQETNNNESLFFTGLDNGVINLDSVYESLDVGNHIISISEIVDGNECSTIDTNLNENSIITVKVNDLPNITHLKDESSQVEDENYYCVGDHISYSLIGTPPFLITYEFNNEIQKSVEITNNLFKRRAPGPGLLSIISLKDSIGCEINFDETKRRDLIGEVYDLPSVEIIQGESIEVDVYEGEKVEITFILTGTPPFQLTYVRLDLDDESKIVETESVENIMGNEYKILANLEGTYEAVVIQDRYCIAKNPKFF